MTSNLGPFQINHIYCGKSEKLMSLLPSDCIDLTVTSPPYDNLRDYHGFTLDWQAVVSQLYRVTKPGGVVVWVVADATVNGSETGTSFKQALWAMECGFNLHDTMIYQTHKAPLAHNRYEQEFEYMFVFSKHKPMTTNLLKTKSIYHGIDKRKGGYYTHNNGYIEDKRIRKGKKRSAPKELKIKGNVWYIKNGHDNAVGGVQYAHPAIFPEALARDHVLSWSNPGDLVFDPFIGSGTTAKMAYQNGRNYLGFDISDEYCELARKRVAYANPPLLIVG